MSKNQWLLAIYAATTRVFVDLIGRLMLAEIIALITLPFINTNQLLKQYKGLRIVLGSLLGLLGAQIISDFYNHSSPSDYLRGWAVIIFTMISTLYLTHHLSKNINNIVYYLGALALVRLLFGEGALDIGMMEENTNYFKTRFVGFLNPAMMLLGYYFYSKKTPQLASYATIGYGLLCMVMDARSNGVIFIIAGSILYLNAARIRVSGSKILLIGLLLSVFLYLGYVYYVNQVLYHGLGGINARTQLSMTSNPYNPFELLYYGRVDFPVLIQASLDKPLFGHGSWGKDPGGKYAQLTAIITGSSSIGTQDYIRAHSILFGFSAYAGLGGLVAVGYLFFQLFKYSHKVYQSNLKLNTLPILMVMSIDMLWNLFFSPIGHLRTGLPLYASLVIVEYVRIQYIGQLLLLKSKVSNTKQHEAGSI